VTSIGTRAMRYGIFMRIPRVVVMAPCDRREPRMHKSV
jgi:hypothetical protein